MEMTVKQIADELGVSKQAVWQRIKRNAELRSAFEEHSRTVNGTVYADEVGVELVRAAYSDYLKTVNVDKTANNLDSKVDETSINGDLTATLRETVSALQEQLAVKDKQIDELTAMLKGSQANVETLTAALTAAQALHAGTMQTALTERSGASEGISEDEREQPPKRKGFFRRIFGKGV